MYFYNYKIFMLEYDIIIGPMFSGKSTELYRRINRFHSIGKRVLIVNHQNDTRTAGISTHDGREYSAIKCSHLMNLKDIHSYDVIGIDEAQFFSDLYEFIFNIARVATDEAALRGNGGIPLSNEAPTQKAPSRV